MVDAVQEVDHDHTQRVPGEEDEHPGFHREDQGEAAQDPERREQSADALLGFMLRQMLAGDIFHADPHPGNVFIRPDGRLELIDFGAVGRLDPYERSGLIDLLRGLHSEQPSVIREGVLRIGTITRSIDEDALDRELARLLSRTRGANDTLNPQLFEELLFVVREFGILLPRSTTTLFRTLGSSFGVAIMGALFNNRVQDTMAERGGELGSKVTEQSAQLDAKSLEKLPDAVREAYQYAVSAGTHSAFLLGSIVAV